jgi:hypothetical protein
VNQPHHTTVRHPEEDSTVLVSPSIASRRMAVIIGFLPHLLIDGAQEAVAPLAPGAISSPALTARCCSASVAAGAALAEQALEHSPLLFAFTRPSVRLEASLESRRVSAALYSLPTLTEQAERLIKLGVHEIGGFSPAELRAAAREAEPDDALLVMGPDRAPASALAPLLERDGKHGFVVVDMSDIDSFFPIEPTRLPAEPMYLVEGLDRGDHMANWSPDEALPAIAASGRTPLTVAEASTGCSSSQRCLRGAAAS